MFGMPAGMSEPKEPQALAQTDDTDEDAPQIVPEAELHFPAAGAASSDQLQSIYRAELADTVSLLNISKLHIRFMLREAAFCCVALRGCAITLHLLACICDDALLMHAKLASKNHVTGVYVSLMMQMCSH